MDKPNYYAIIPAEVRYSDIKPSAKLLYGEITCLSNLKGYCYATNNYFALLYKVSKNTISLWVKSLNDAGFIKVQMIYKNKQIIERRMTIINFQMGITKNDDSSIIINDEVNNTRINNTSISIIKRKNIFNDSLNLLNIDNEIKKEFESYWTEMNPSKTKMRYELEKTWCIEKRMKRWKTNSKRWNPSKVSKLKSTLSAHQKAKEMINNINNK